MLLVVRSWLGLTRVHTGLVPAERSVDPARPGRCDGAASGAGLTPTTTGRVPAVNSLLHKAVSGATRFPKALVRDSMGQPIRAISGFVQQAGTRVLHKRLRLMADWAL
jgi:hypothetical protein